MKIFVFSYKVFLL